MVAIGAEERSAAIPTAGLELTTPSGSTHLQVEHMTCSPLGMGQGA